MAQTLTPPLHLTLAPTVLPGLRQHDALRVGLPFGQRGRQGAVDLRLDHDTRHRHHERRLPRERDEGQGGRARHQRPRRQGRGDDAHLRHALRAAGSCLSPLRLSHTRTWWLLITPGLPFALQWQGVMDPSIATPVTNATVFADPRDTHLPLGGVCETQARAVLASVRTRGDLRLSSARVSVHVSIHLGTLYLCLSILRTL